MIFQSIPFLFGFLPLFLLGYFIAPKRYRNAVLVIGSLLFYAWGEPIYVALLIVSVIYCFNIAVRMEKATPTRRKKLLVQAIAIHVFALLYMKYYGFFLDTLQSLFHTTWTYKTCSMPLGISFYTFMMLSYLIDVYQGKVKASKKLIDFAAYATFFPKLVMGPIERYANMEAGIQNNVTNLSLFGEGVERFLKGLTKKVLLADGLGIIWAQVSTMASGELTVLTAWIGAIAYTLQIYYDFSGYTDMAIGIGKMLGFQLQENFNFPYLSRSITMFWNRWHISLSTWFRDYIYIPLGGNRVSKGKHLRNIMIVWMLTGFWHGANWTFIVWGLYFGVLLILEKYVWKNILAKLPKVISWAITMILIIISWMIFAAPDIDAAGRYIMTMFFMGDHSFVNQQTLWILSNQGLLILLGVVFVLPLEEYFMNRLKPIRGGAIL
ncbi:MAG: MBOAT family O-acyltransferase, partial [Longicatena sp.]